MVTPLKCVDAGSADSCSRHVQVPEVAQAGQPTQPRIADGRMFQMQIHQIHHPVHGGDSLIRNTGAGNI